MEKPQLLVVAGCNGAGKSSYSRILSPEGIAVFDYDKHFLEIYSSIIPTDFQDQMAHSMAFQKLETQIDQAIDAGKSFAYEIDTIKIIIKAYRAMIILIVKDSM
ncbi:hypothetical protein [Algoriphagus resistens]|uniref:hypothetical protein n=1 Tax=Algoriphagus resistens TaxID=1750590 RepID=UPI000716BBFB|nr:hypothetical protein [Algoriphagus resistens]